MRGAGQRLFVLGALVAACSSNGGGASSSGVGKGPEERPPAERQGAAPAALPDCEWCGAREAPEDLSWDVRIAGEDEPGEPLEISGTVRRADGSPAAGLVLYLYHTNAEGVYVARGDETGNGPRHGRLRGWLRTDEDGRYRFRTIRPARYPGHTEPAHVHVTVLDGGVEYWLDDFVFAGDPLLDVYRDRAREIGGSGIVALTRDEDRVWRGTRDIVLPAEPPDGAR